MLGQQLIHGLSLGLIYGLVAVGLVMVYSTTRIVNFAHGELFTLAAFFALHFMRDGGLPFAAAGALATLLIFVLAGAFALVVTKLPDAMTRSVATIALGFGLRDLMLVVFGSDSSAFGPVYPQGAVLVSGTRLTYASLIINAAALILLVAVGIVVWRTRWGIFMRAVAQNPSLATATGIESARWRAVAFGGGAAVAGLAGVLVSPEWHVTYNGGAAIGMKAFAAALIGGFHSSFGTLLGGIIVGILETLIAAYVSTAWKDLYVYLALVLVLIVFPRGVRGLGPRRLA